MIVLAILIVAGAFAHWYAGSQSAERWPRRRRGWQYPTVGVIKPSAEPAADQLVLPAQLQAYVESAIYARTNGYLLRWNKDIGSQVKKGELLAEIDTPEVDQELTQAKAAKQQTVAQMQFAKSTAERWVNLRKTDSVSQQEADQQSSAYTQAVANNAAAEANVRRLQQLESFKHIYAPISGVITRRNTDLGALITAGSSGTGKELFDIAQVDPLRVFVSVPQSNAPAIRAGFRHISSCANIPARNSTAKSFAPRTPLIRRPAPC